MSINLQDFSSNSTDYISRLNSNNEVLETAIGGLQNTVTSAATSTLSLLALEQALFGTTTSLLGAGSYARSNTSTTVTLQPGFAWVPDLLAVVSKGTSTTLNFSGQSAGAYYIALTLAGIPTISNSSRGAIYQVIWNGTTVGGIINLATTIPTTLDSLAALTSGALGVTYDTLDARFEAIENSVIAGGPAWTTLKANTSKSVAGAANVTLTATESQARLITLTGALTASINVTLNTTGPRDWVIYNNTSGNYSITVKGATGTGTVVPQGGVTTVVWDGTNLKQTTGTYGVVDVPWAANMTLNLSLYDTIRVTLAGSTTFTFTGSVDNAKCILELTQDAVGGHAVTWPVNARGSLSVPLPSPTLTANALDRIGFIYHRPSGKYDCTAAVMGY